MVQKSHKTSKCFKYASAVVELAAGRKVNVKNWVAKIFDCYFGDFIRNMIKWYELDGDVHVDETVSTPRAFFQQNDQLEGNCYDISIHHHPPPFTQQCHHI